MSHDSVLTSLCSICHTNPIKYTCPRCSTHTCSLPCVRKHKTWAQCSGVRDPAEYRKRSELATALSIDKDFNFITSVERQLTRAESEATGRGINLAPARIARHNDGRSKVDVEVEDRGVKVIRAPKGLSRSKSNKTSWAGNSKTVVWTVEWVLQNGEKITTQASEVKDLKELYVSSLGRKNLKRKRNAPVGKIQQDSEHGQNDKTAAAIVAGPAESATRVVDELSTVSSQAQDREPQIPAPDVVSSTLDNPLEGLYIYLHKPDTPSKYKCLIPVSSQRSLREVLEGRTVLEYPTFYVKHEPPDGLVAPFIDEETYLKKKEDEKAVQLVVPKEEEEEGELLEPV